MRKGKNEVSPGTIQSGTMNPVVFVTQVLGGQGQGRLFAQGETPAQSEERVTGSSVLRNPRTVGLVLERKIIRFCYR